MLSAKSVIPECCIDSCLFDVLLNFQKESVNHTKGNGTVVAKMESKFANLFCIGIIDKDKRDLKYLDDKCERVVGADVERYFKIFKHRERHHYIIQMVPVIEVWIYNVAGELGVNIRDYDISASNPHELASITKKVSSKDDPRFNKLFKEFFKRSIERDFHPLLKLKRAIGLILEKNYKLDINELKNG